MPVLKLVFDPINFVGLIATYLLENKLPALDRFGRPVFAYGEKIHKRCPFKENEQGRCLEDAGCKGRQTYNNCPSIKFNEGTSFPMQAGHPCIGCSEPAFWDRMTPFYTEHEGDVDPCEGDLDGDGDVDGRDHAKYASEPEDDELQGREPTDAWLFTQRLCGVCTYVHGASSVTSDEKVNFGFICNFSTESFIKWRSYGERQQGQAK